MDITAYWIYDLPTWVLAVLTVGTSIQVGVLGLFILRPLVGRLVGHSGKHNDIVSYTFSAVGVFYGLTLGLIAVATWQNYTGADELVTKEAALLGALYRDLNAYPRPTRGELEGLLYKYTDQIINAEWPAHQKGKSLDSMTKSLDDFELVVMGFTPHGDREKLVHNEVIKSLGVLQGQRQLRMQAVLAGLPAVLWVVVLCGALMTFVPMWLFWVENVKLHAILVGIQALVLGLLIFLTAAMDNPFRGEFSVSSAAFDNVFHRLAKPESITNIVTTPQPDSGYKEVSQVSPPRDGAGKH